MERKGIIRPWGNSCRSKIKRFKGIKAINFSETKQKIEYSKYERVEKRNNNNF